MEEHFFSKGATWLPLFHQGKAFWNETTDANEGGGGAKVCGYQAPCDRIAWAGGYAKGQSREPVHFITMTDKAIQPEAQSGLLTRRLVGIKEMAGYVGLSVHTLYAMVSQRRIPVKVGRLTKFDVSMLDAWIKKNSVMPRSQITPLTSAY